MTDQDQADQDQADQDQADQDQADQDQADQDQADQDCPAMTLNGSCRGVFAFQRTGLPVGRIHEAIKTKANTVQNPYQRILATTRPASIQQC